MPDSRRSGALRVAGLAAALLLAAASAVGCGGADEPEPGAGVTVVASFFALAEAVERVGGDAVAVTDLTPGGGDPHGAELTVAQVDAIEDADLAVVLGGDFQPAMEERARRRDGATLVVLDELSVGAGSDDPHVWLDPVLMQEIARAVESALAELDPAHEESFRRRADAYVAELDGLDDDLGAALATCARHEIVTTHAAFGWLAARYGLEQHAIAGVSPDDEPSAARIADLADFAAAAGVTTVFAESTGDPALAEALAREAGGLRVATLHTLEARTGDQRDRDLGYAELMRENGSALEQGLGCRQS